MSDRDRVSNLLSFATTITIAASVGGYLYANVVLRYFHISPSAYLQVYDYLTLGFDFPTLIIVAVLSGHVKEHFNPPIIMKEQRRATMLSRLLSFIVAMLIAGTLWYLFSDRDLTYFILPFFWISIVFGVLFCVQPYFPDVKFPGTYFGVVVAVSVTVILAAMLRSWTDIALIKLRSGASSTIWTYKMEKISISTMNHRIILSTSNYIFFLAEGDDVVILPASQLQLVRSRATTD